MFKFVCVKDNAELLRHLKFRDKLRSSPELVNEYNNIVSGFIMQKRFIMLHTIMNKVTGLLLFVLPLTVPFVDLKYTAILVCVVATFAAIQEGHFIRTNRF